MLLSEILQVIPADVSVVVCVYDEQKHTEYYYPHSHSYVGMPLEWVYYRVTKVKPTGGANNFISIIVEEIEC